MEFTLTYRGPLSANGGPKEKQVLRRQFHKQLQELWKQPPLKDKTIHLKNPQPLYADPIEEVGAFRFAPLVSARFRFTASLEVNFLRPGYPGQLLGTGGDIDNRVKTLLDALAKPQENQIPSGDLPRSDENPFFCLLQDDALVTGLSVITDRLLDHQSEREVLLLIHVKTRCHSGDMISNL